MNKHPGKFTFKRYPLEPQDVDLLVAACQDDKERIIIIGLVDTGLRIGELLALTKDNIYLERNILVFESEKSRGALRQVPLTARLRELLIRLDCVIPAMSQQTAENITKRVAKRAGVERYVVPHVLRHTYAVNALCSGVDIRTLQRRLGHADIATTALYLKYVPDNILNGSEE